MPFTGPAETGTFYEVVGSDDAEPLVLIHGAGAQLIAWSDRFVELLTDAGFQVILFDNRDVGLSERFEGGRADYDLNDMADDVARLLDHLGLPDAHVAGQSMGGVIAQQFALNHPARVRSLCLMYTAHRFSYLLNDPEIAQLLAAPPAETREGRIAYYLQSERLAGLDDVNEDDARIMAERVVDRAWDPAGAQRQSQAILRSPENADRLAEIQVPTSILHGTRDRMIDFGASLEMARLIDDAELHILPDMGHQVRPSYWPDFVQALRRNAERARRKRSTLDG